MRGEWINKLRYIQTMGYYSVLKRNELSRHERTWRNFKGTLLSERRQSEKSKQCIIPLYGILKRKHYGDNKKIHGFLG